MSKDKRTPPEQTGLGDALFGTRLDESRTQSGRSGADIFIVDNSDSDWKVRKYLQEWTDIAYSIDIATGYFEIGALLALDGNGKNWRALES